MLGIAYHKVNRRPSETKLFNPGTNPNTTCARITATLTCYDLLFREQAHCPEAEFVSLFVTGSCANQFPFLMSTAVAQGWSNKNWANIIIATQHFPSMYSTGSGVYQSGLATNYMISGEEWTMGTGKMLQGDVH